MSTKAPNPVDKYVGSRVRMRRIMLGMSQEKLGEALGLTFQQVQKYEKGTNRVGASRIQQISEILQVPVSFLFEGGPSGIARADGAGEGTSPTYVSDFPATAEGLALTRAFTRITDAKLRRSIVEMSNKSPRAKGLTSAKTGRHSGARVSADPESRDSGSAQKVAYPGNDNDRQQHADVLQSLRCQNHSRRHPPLGRDRNTDGSTREGQQARDHGRGGLSRSPCHHRARRRTFRLRRSHPGAFVVGPGCAGNPGAETPRHGSSPWIYPAPAVQNRGPQRLRRGHLRHERRRLSRLPCVRAALCDA